MRQKGFAPITILVAVLTVLIIGGGTYYLGTKTSINNTTQQPSASPVIPQPTTTPTVDQIANWKTYTNSTYGISINYPQEYTFKSEGPNISQQQLDNGDQISGTISPSFDTIDFTGGSQDFSLGIFHKNTPAQISDTSSGFDGSCGSQFIDKTLINQIGQIGNIKYHKLEQSRSSKINLQYCFLSNTQNLAVLSAFNLNANNVSSADQFLQKILSILQVTNVSTMDTAKWKTYGDSNYSFSVQYSAAWPDPIIHTDYYDNSNYHIFLSDGRHFGDLVEIRVLPNPKKLSAPEYFKTEAFKNDLPGWNNNQRSTQTVNLPNVDVIRIEGFTGGSGDRGPTAFISKGTIVIEVITQNNTQSGAQQFNQILSTFKFTN